MIIKDVRITLLRMPWVGQPAHGKAISPREVLVVEIETVSGIIGMGHIMLIRGGLETIGACLREMIVPRILGKDATQIEAIWYDLYRATYTVGRMGVAIIALWQWTSPCGMLWEESGSAVTPPMGQLPK